MASRTRTISEDGTYPLDIHQGVPLARQFRLLDDEGDPVSLAGYDGRAQVRDSADGGALLLTLTVSVNQAASGDDAGRVTISATGAETGAMRRGGVWDLELDNGNPAQEILLIALSPANLIRQVTT